LKWKRYEVRVPQTEPPETEGWEQVSFGYWKMSKTWSQTFKDTYRKVDPKKKNIMTENEFENQLFLNLVANVKNEILTFFELGAAIGDWCLEIAGIIDFKLIKTKAVAYRFLGVEGEPTHYLWGTEHFEKQKINGQMLHAVALDYDGKCSFLVGNPDTWYGQFVSPGGVETSCFTVDTLIKKLGFPHLDICHMDVQEAELKVLKGCTNAIKDKTIDYFSIRTHNSSLHSEIIKILEADYNILISILPNSGIVDTPIGKANVYQDGIIIAERKDLAKQGTIDQEKFIRGVQAMRLRIGVIGIPEPDVWSIFDELEGKVSIKIYDPKYEKYIKRMWKIETVADVNKLLYSEVIMPGRIMEEIQEIKMLEGSLIADPLRLLDWTSKYFETFSDLEMVAFSREEKAIIEKLSRSVSGKLFIDIGAFLGEYTINLAENFQEIWAFEPATDSRLQLEKNLASYKISNVKVFPEAVYSHSGYQPLFRKEGHHGGMTGIKQHYKRGIEEVLENPLEVVPTKSLDEIVGNRTVSLIKIDVEGAELDILQGGRQALKNTERILVEIHDPYDRAKVEELLKEAGLSKFTYLQTNHLLAEREES